MATLAIKGATQSMILAVNHLQAELKNIRSGRANPGLLEPITVGTRVEGLLEPITVGTRVEGLLEPITVGTRVEANLV